ncbi:MAG TPA: metallophosphoesterase, partial [Fimbriimonas sp.]|nr:metallophosphoesterase [Fimbriimonas sp.]
KKDWISLLSFGFGAVGAATLVYGALVESKRLVVDRLGIPLKGLPEDLDGFKIAVLSDFHLGDPYALELAKKAVDLALDNDPDMVCLLGDFVNYWKPLSPKMLGEVLEPLLVMNGAVVAIPGNHDYKEGSPEILRVIFDELDIKLLRNESWDHKGICWVGVDSYNEDQADVVKAFSDASSELPKITLWHEPDLVSMLPSGESLLQLSGHSHGGQYVLPWIGAPMTSTNGKKYLDGFYPDAPTPLFVSRGIGTTGPPSRFNCPPQVAILTLESV